MSNKSPENINVYDAAWLYLIYYIYDNKYFKVDSWKNDKRMGGETTCEESLSKFDIVSEKDGIYIITDIEKAKEIIDHYFGSKTFKGALLKGDTLKEYDYEDKYYGYRVSKIPYDLFMRKHPNLQEDFDKIDNMFVIHYNSQRCSDHIAEKLSKSRNIKYYNLLGLHTDFPNIPDKIKVYRGIKNKYDVSYNKKGYSCWTHNKKQGERFAKYIFTGNMQFEPMYSKSPYLLEAEIDVKDIAVFIGGSEGEVILKNPVNITKIYPLYS